MLIVIDAAMVFAAASKAAYCDEEYFAENFMACAEGWSLELEPKWPKWQNG